MRLTQTPSSWAWHPRVALLPAVLLAGCYRPEAAQVAAMEEAAALQTVVTEVEAAVWAFHAADTAKDAEGVIDLLWPEYAMFVDGSRSSYEETVAGARAFMPSLDLFHTVWTDVRVTALGPDAAVSSFMFADSIVTKAGELIRSRGPTTFVWQRRAGEWRILFGDADHYPIQP